jgi:hypothetical protein
VNEILINLRFSVRSTSVLLRNQIELIAFLAHVAFKNKIGTIDITHHGKKIYSGSPRTNKNEQQIQIHTVHYIIRKAY